jgi:anti-sigma B factor antagonist
VNDFDAPVRQDGEMATVDLAGVIDGGADTALEAAYARCDELRARTVALDFTKVDYINSTGIALLVSLLAKARRDGRPVVAWGLTDHYREIFEITRLADFLEVVADEQAAQAVTSVTPDEE